jgi:hypothetical protein
MSVQQSDLNDPALVTEVDLARAAAQEEAGDERVGEYVSYHMEDEAAVTHLFEADKAGYGGWRWAVTITSAGPSSDITVSEVVLLPGPSALVAPDWVPWQYRVQAGDLGVGDLLPTSPDDPRLVPAYVASDDPAVEEVAVEVGLGRARVMSRPARLDAATRWQESEYGPSSDMARSAPAHCGTCGFYLPLAGSLRAVFGTCGNEISPADGHVVHAEYGCGAHSEAEVEQVSPVLVADLIYDDAQLDVEPLVVVDEIPAPAEDRTTVVEPSPELTPPTAESESPEAETPSELDASESASLETEPTEEPGLPEPSSESELSTPSSELESSVTSPLEAESSSELESSAASSSLPAEDPTAVVMESVAAVEAPSSAHPAPAVEAAVDVASVEIPLEASVGMSPAPVAEGISAPPAEVAPARRRRQRALPEEPSVSESTPSPLRPQMELPTGLGPRRLPRLSIRVPRALIRRKDFGPTENE